MKNVKTIEITIEGESWTKSLDKAFKKKNKEVKIEGFRKGMAPKELYIKKIFLSILYYVFFNFNFSDMGTEFLSKN